MTKALSPIQTAIEGTVRSVLTTKGYGFITSQDGRSFFFHRQDAPDFNTLRVGSIVSFFPVRPRDVEALPDSPVMNSWP